MYKTHTCGALRPHHATQTVTLSGWVARLRDHGGLRFIDLRDAHGVTQLLCAAGTESFTHSLPLKAEWCIQVTGVVVTRDPALINKDIQTGAIEIRLESIRVLSQSKELPFAISEEKAPESLRYKHRYLDLRRDSVRSTMAVRAKTIRTMREVMWAEGFEEYQTPLLTSPSPEGARDYLVPSSKHPGKVYALPQAPQLFKQMLMVGGVEKYFQIAPCFRDESARADRLATEFYQLDIEMSFVTQEDVFSLIERIVPPIFAAQGHTLSSDWPRIPYAESLRLYGTDKPDLRCPLVLHDVSSFFQGGPFTLFASILERPHAHIIAIPAPGGGRRKFCEGMDAHARAAGLPGMAWIYWDEDGDAKGPVAKSLGDQTEQLRKHLALEPGDAVCLAAGDLSLIRPYAAQARVEIGQRLEINTPGFAFAWITDFPLFAQEKDGTYSFEHNPFSQPQGGAAALKGDPLAVIGYQYDLACNGYEILSGAIRCHDVDTLLESFSIAGYDTQQAYDRFGGLLRALSYGPPPHGGCALGIERIIMLLTNEKAIRDVVTFPTSQSGEDLLLDGPKPFTDEEKAALGLPAPYGKC